MTNGGVSSQMVSTPAGAAAAGAAGTDGADGAAGAGAGRVATWGIGPVNSLAELASIWSWSSRF